MRNCNPLPATAAESAIAITNSLSLALFDVHNIQTIPKAALQPFVQEVNEENLSGPELRQIRNDRHQATEKCMVAFQADQAAEAARITSQAQQNAQMLACYVDIGRRVHAGRKAGGQKTGEKKRQIGKVTEAKVHDMATKLLAIHKPREISGIIKNRLAIERSTVLRYLRTHPSGYWPPKKSSTS